MQPVRVNNGAPMRPRAAERRLAIAIAASAGLAMPAAAQTDCDGNMVNDLLEEFQYTLQAGDWFGASAWLNGAGSTNDPFGGSVALFEPSLISSQFMEVTVNGPVDISGLRATGGNTRLFLGSTPFDVTGNLAGCRELLVGYNPPSGSQGDASLALLGTFPGSSATSIRTVIGSDAGVEGVLIIDTTTLQHSPVTGSLLIGHQGTGTVSVINDSSLSLPRNTVIGASRDSSGEIVVDGSSNVTSALLLPRQGVLSIGESGSGRVSLAPGATFTSRAAANAVVALDPGSSGTINLGSGAAADIVANTINIGVGGSARITLGNGAVLHTNAANGISVGGRTIDGTDGNGLIELYGNLASWMDASDGFSFGLEGQADLILGAGASAESMSSPVVGQRGVIRGDGTFKTSGAMTPVTLAGGALVPVDPPLPSGVADPTPNAILQIDAGLLLAEPGSSPASRAGSFNATIRPGAASDIVEVTGPVNAQRASANVTLDPTAPPPQIGDKFTILQSQVGVTGSLASLNSSVFEDAAGDPAVFVLSDPQPPNAIEVEVQPLPVPQRELDPPRDEAGEMFAIDSELDDMNGDGLPDLVQVVDSPAVGIPATVVIRQNLGNNAAGEWQGFGPAQAFPLAGRVGPIALTTGDINGDELPDAIVAVEDQDGPSVVILLSDIVNPGTLPTIDQRPIDLNGTPIDIDTLDANLDGLLDITILTRGTPPNPLIDPQFALFGPAGTSTIASQLGGMFLLTELPTEDDPTTVESPIRGGDSQAVASADTDTVTVTEGFGGGALITEIAVGGGPNGLEAFDADGDGETDLATSNGDGGSVSVSITISDGMGGLTFAPAITLLPDPDNPAGSNPASIVAGDFNADGLDDLAVIATVAGDRVVLRADSLGVDGGGIINFTAFEALPGEDDPALDDPIDLYVDDIDDDGFDDVVVIRDTSGGVPPAPPLPIQTRATSAPVTVALSAPPPCNAADIAAPFGVLDLSDVQTFLIGFASNDPVADIVTDNLFDLQDVQTFLIAFGSGCP